MPCGFLFNHIKFADDCYSVDLNSPSPSWVQLQDIPRKSSVMTGGFLPHVDKSGQLSLFAVYDRLCDTNEGKMHLKQMQQALPLFCTVFQMSSTDTNQMKRCGRQAERHYQCMLRKSAND